MNHTVEQRAAKITFVGVIAFAFSFLQSIFIVPVILSNWGGDKYGHWLAIFAGFNLLQTLDLGHQHFIGNEINVTYFRSMDDLKKILSSSLMIAWLIGFVEVLITLGLILSGHISSLLGIKVTGSEYMYSILSIMIMWFIFGSVSGIITKILVPVGRFYTSQWIALIISLVQFIGLIIVVVLKGSILVAAIIYSLLQSVMIIGVLIYLRKILPEFFPWWEKGTLRTGVINFTRSIRLTLNIIIQQLSINGLVLFISNFYAIVQVPAFTTIRTLTNTAGSFNNIINSAISPDIVKYHSKGENDKLYLSLTANLFLGGIIVNFGLVLSLLFIEPFYRLWTHGELIFNRSLFLFLAAGVSFSNYGIGIVTYFFSTNKLKEFSYVNVLKSVTLFAAAYVLLKRMDITTIGISVALSELAASVIVPVFLMRKIKADFFSDNRLTFFIFAVIPPFLISALAVLSYINIFMNIYIPISLLVLSLVYFLSWKTLDVEFKTRFWSITKKLNFIHV